MSSDIEINKLYHMDCMDLMKIIPDKFFDLAIVDPPYFSGPEKRGYYGRKTSPIGVKRSYHVSENWKVPEKEYFKELFRVSKNQIIWGCNYYDYIFPTSGRIIWDKCNGKSSFSNCEIADCSLHKSVKLFRYMWNGMMQGKSITEGHIQRGDKRLNEKRIHPTQKPVEACKYFIETYTNPGDVVLDNCMGAGSIGVAAVNTGRRFLGIEIDPSYYEVANARISAAQAERAREEEKNENR